MGGCFSVSCSCDQVLNQVSQWLCVKESYIHNLEENLEALETTIAELKAKRNDLLRRVEREENKGLRRLDQIQVWLTRVENIESEVNGLFNDKTTELQRLCLCGFCSKSFKKSYGYGKRVFMMLKDVENVRSNGVFEVVADQTQASEVVKRPVQPTIVGRETLIETAWNHLMEDGVGILGMYGMGGVGKTTVLNEINNKCDTFDIVIWVVVSSNLQIHKIQEDIAKKLGMAGDGWNRKDEDQKACDLHNVLRRKKFVLLLDDIWAKADLMKIGVPFPSRENGSKVVFTTRSREVCGRMGADVEMEVQCLPTDDALDLFRKKVGEITLMSHPRIPELAVVVAKKCHGLPLALNVIGEAMSYKRTTQEWQNAIDVLTLNAAKFSEMKGEILPILKFSYDDIKDEHVKSCLLYCALFPEDYKILKSDLIEYWLYEEGIIDGSGGMERAENQGYEIIGSLVRSSMLMEEDTDKVYMHDVVREMALWIASDQFIVFAGVGLYGIPKFMNWNAARRMSLMDNKIDCISGSLECLELTTLLLHRNKRLVNISGEFFRSLPKLVVLDLSDNIHLFELPEEISDLVSLKYLNLKETDIQCLPVGLQELKNLIHLNLEWTENLSSIVGISALLNLKVLKLRGSRVSRNLNTVEELLFLEHLEILTIDISCDSGLDQFLSSQKLLCCTQTLEIIGLQLESPDIWRLAISEIKKDITSIRSVPVSLLQNPTNAFFLSLSKISLRYIKCGKELTWLMFAPNLTHLTIFEAEEVEEIINKEKALVGEESGILPFQKLQFLSLGTLPELKNIYWRPLPFPCLTRIEVINCPKLRKLPLNSKSGSNGEKRLVIEYTEIEWLEGVEWEDEATEARFLPSVIFQDSS